MVKAVKKNSVRRTWFKRANIIFICLVAIALAWVTIFVFIYIVFLSNYENNNEEEFPISRMNQHKGLHENVHNEAPIYSAALYLQKQDDSTLSSSNSGKVTTKNLDEDKRQLRYLLDDMSRRNSKLCNSLNLRSKSQEISHQILHWNLLQNSIQINNSYKGWWFDGNIKNGYEVDNTNHNLLLLRLFVNQRATGIYQFIPLKGEIIKIDSFIFRFKVTNAKLQSDISKLKFCGAAISFIIDANGRLFTAKYIPFEKIKMIRDYEVRIESPLHNKYLGVMITFSCINDALLNAKSKEFIEIQNVSLYPEIYPCFEQSDIDNIDIHLSAPNTPNQFSIKKIKATPLQKENLLISGTNNDKSMKPDKQKSAIGLCMHGSLDRLDTILQSVCLWVDNALGPVVISLYVGMDLYVKRDIELKVREYCGNRSKFDINIILASSSDEIQYPINTLRNLAIESLKENDLVDYIFLLDADLIPSRTIGQSLLDSFSFLDTVDKVALVIPAFEQLSMSSKPPKYLLSATKKEIVQSWKQRKSITPYKLAHQAKAHGATNFDKWAETTDKNPYQISWNEHFEPYVVLRRKDIIDVYFDERLDGYGFNKVLFITELAMREFKFYVSTDAWVIHIAHEKTEISKEFSNNINARIANRAKRFVSLVSLLERIRH